MKQTLAAFAVGLVFGLGLVTSQMINPAKIIGFLNVAGDWDPTLAVVMASALATSFIGYRLVLARHAPLLDEAFHLPANTRIDRKLIIGAGVFGIGWGLSGLCPGPGVAASAVGGALPFVYLAAMLAGMRARDLVKL
ncbi:MAG: DUF6691 family protein [Pseudomonadota bacterium]